MNEPTSASSTFDGLGIAPNLRTVLTNLHFTKPTPIQLQAIPSGIEGKDIIGIAQTGTGKTLAFGIPLIQRLLQMQAQGAARGLVLVPTRELALQVEEHLSAIGRTERIRTAVLIGGMSMVPQLRALKNNPHIVIATPGRLIDHLEQRNLKLDTSSIIVLDEADRMLDMGFWPQIKKIIAELPPARQMMLFSATLSPEIMELARSHMKLPTRIEVAPQGSTAENVSQEIFIVRREDKPRLLEKVLADSRGSTIVFSRTKHGASRIMKSVRRMGHSSAEIHSNRTLGQRRDALEGFKTGRYRVLVATDIAARGIDVTGIELVINYDLPQASADYVHRIGRTARAGASGRAISFALPSETHDVRDIERLIRRSIPRSPMPTELPPLRPIPAGESAERDFTPRTFARSSRPSQSRSFSSRSSAPRTFTPRSSAPRSFEPRSPQSSASSEPRTFPSRAPRPQGEYKSSRPGMSRPSFGSRPQSGNFRPRRKFSDGGNRNG